MSIIVYVSDQNTCHVHRFNPLKISFDSTPPFISRLSSSVSLPLPINSTDFYIFSAQQFNTNAIYPESVAFQCTTCACVSCIQTTTRSLSTYKNVATLSLSLVLSLFHTHTNTRRNTFLVHPETKSTYRMRTPTSIKIVDTVIYMQE